VSDKLMMLPSSWKIIRLGDICKTTSGGTPSRTREDYYGGTIPWVKSGELCDGIVSEIGESITDEGLKNSSAKVFTKGSLLIALYGATVGKLGILSRDASTNQAVCGIFPSEAIETKYLFWYLRSIRSELIDKGQGGAQPNISQGIVKDIQIPLAPLKDQQQIIAEIEKQFSRLDEAIASLKRIQANLKRYKAAVLKAAVEGKLTEQWRKDHPDVEPANQLLKRILAERRANWEAEELAKMKAKGIKPKDDSWKKKYKEPADPDTSNLPELPEGWLWVSLESISDVIDPNPSHRMPKYVSKGIPTLGN
jgi:type I restriction enzyme, S subunit